MMKLANMKLDPAARTPTSQAYPAPPDQRPMYPYGLELSLDQDALKALGLVDALPAVGASLKLSALVDVTSVSENESADGGKSCNVRLQITDLGLEAKAAKKSDAEVIYGKGKE
jgi:hypothetical protein